VSQKLIDFLSCCRTQQASLAFDMLGEEEKLDKDPQKHLAVA
jgi:hypothetical protein